MRLRQHAAGDDAGGQAHRIAGGAWTVRAADSGGNGGSDAMTWQDIHPNMFEGSSPRVFATKPDDPEAGRVFVWAQARWFERVESPTENGAIEFSPIADTEEDVRDMVRVDGGEMDELDNDFAATVKDSFLNQVPLYPDTEADTLSDWEAGA